MVYYSIKCPHCGSVVESGHDRTERYGSPFRKCRHCGRGYVDTNYIEPGVLSESELYGKKLNWRAPVIIAFGAFMLYGAITGESILLAFVGLACLALGITSIVSTIKYNPKADESLARDLAESRKRLSDPHYVIALWKAECHMNPDLVNWAKREIEKEQKQSRNSAVNNDQVEDWSLVGNSLDIQSRYCRKCGTELMDGSRFCRKCGTEICSPSSTK